MEIYNEFASFVGWPAIVAILLLAGGYAFFALNNRIEFLKERIEGLEKDNSDLRQYSPDILAISLADRLRISSEELERIKADEKSSQKLIQTKEIELKQVKFEIHNLHNKVKKELELLHLVAERELLCFHCGAPLEIRDIHEDTHEIDGRDIDISNEIVIYECGHEIINGNIVSECPQLNSTDQIRLN